MRKRACSHSQQEVGYVIVNFFTADLVLNHLKVLALNTLESLHVVVVDNSCDPAEEDYLERVLPPGVCLLVSKENFGYGHGNNMGMSHVFETGGLYSFIANPDSSPTKNLVEGLLDFIRSDSDFGAVGPAVFRESGSPASAGFQLSLDPPMRKALNAESTQPYEVDYLEGCFFLLSLAAWKAAGDFNVSYFLYFEEVEFFLRIRDNGFLVLVNPEMRVTHGSERNKNFSPHYLYYLSRNASLLATDRGLSADKVQEFGRFWESEFVEPTRLRLQSSGRNDVHELLEFLQKGLVDGAKQIRGKTILPKTGEVARQRKELEHDLMPEIERLFPREKELDNWQVEVLQSQIRELEFALDARVNVEHVKAKSEPLGKREIVRILSRLSMSPIGQRLLRIRAVREVSIRLAKALRLI
jgi:N-acetylglucosaminyl-diphospho-decaprenol L-rhamnosyltransferase